MIVADHHNHRVVILDQIGRWLLKINGNVSGAQGFKNPWGLALDPQGNIHVTANGSNTIKSLHTRGDLCQIIWRCKESFWNSN